MVSSREPLIYITAIYCNDSFARSQVMPVTGLISSSFCECCVCERAILFHILIVHLPLLQGFLRRGSQHPRTTCRTLEHCWFWCDPILSLQAKAKPKAKSSAKTMKTNKWSPAASCCDRLNLACVFLHWWLGRWFVIVCSFSFEICATEWRGHAVCAWKWMPADFVCSTCLMLFITSHVLWSNAVACISFSWLLTCWSDCALITAPFLT